jgi:hypothetical protein
MNVVDAVLQQVGGQARLLLFYLESETVNKTDAPRYRCMPNLIKTKFNMKATECIRPYTGRDEKGCAHSAVAYTATLYHMMVKIMKGGGRAPPTLTSLGKFFHHDGMHPEIGRCHSVYTLEANTFSKKHPDRYYCMLGSTSKICITVLYPLLLLQDLCLETS